MKVYPSIVELFGQHTSSTLSNSLLCPFIGRTCGKALDSTPSGVCVVSKGSTTEEVIVCPNRFYGNNYSIIGEVAAEIWPQDRFIVGGTKIELKQTITKSTSPITTAWGHHSGHEIQITRPTKMSFDWILRHHDKHGDPDSFVGIEVQSMDTTGNYREALASLRRGETPFPSSHGINWANVHKRLIPQLIRKGRLLSHTPGCRGFFFLLQDAVYQRFEAVLGPLQTYSGPDAGILSVRTFETDRTASNGLKQVRAINIAIDDIAAAYQRIAPEAIRQLSDLLME